MAKIIIDRYTAVGIGGYREKSYNRATIPTVASNAITVHGTRDIAYGLRPNLDGMPKLEISTIDDQDVLNRPWDAPSEIQRVSKMVKVDMTFPRITLTEAAILITMALSNHNTIKGTEFTKVMATPKNVRDDLELYSTCVTANLVRSSGPDMGATDGARAAADYKDEANAFDPGVIRAFDGFFVNGFELSMARGTERLWELTIDGYASGTFQDAAVLQVGSNWLQNHYVGAELVGTSQAQTEKDKDDFRRTYVDSRIIKPTGEYMRGTRMGAWISYMGDPDGTLINFTRPDSRRLTGQEVGDRSTSPTIENLKPIGSSVAGPATLPLNNLGYDLRISYNNNIDAEDLMRWGAGDSFTAAEKALSTLEVTLEIDMQDYGYMEKLLNNHNFAMQFTGAVGEDEGYGFLFPLMRQRENTMSRQGIKRTQQITFVPIGIEAASAPFYADFNIKNGKLEGDDILPIDTSGNSQTAIGRS